MSAGAVPGAVVLFYFICFFFFNVKGDGPRDLPPTSTLSRNRPTYTVTLKKIESVKKNDKSYFP